MSAVSAEIHLQFAVAHHPGLTRGWVVVVALIVACAGCGEPASPVAPPAETLSKNVSTQGKTPVAPTPRSKPRPAQPAQSVPQAENPNEAPKPDSEVELQDSLPASSAAGAIQAPREIDEDRVKAHGIRTLTSRHLTLFTDFQIDAEIEQLPELFDRAVPQWCGYFGLAEEIADAWRVRGHLMKERERFAAAGLLPDDLPDFVNGYALPNEIWWYDRSSAYYRRHLMLHEGTHAFVFMARGDCGPPWYMEGLAELLGTHSLDDGKLRLGVFPSRPDDMESWDRIHLVRSAVADGRLLPLAEIMAYELGVRSETEPYGWCWAVSAFLDGHPRYRERFRKLPDELPRKEFNRRVLAIFAGDWRDLNDEWEVFAAGIEFGYDLSRNAIEFTPGRPMPASGKELTIRADRGWQPSGVRLEAGAKYKIAATGRYQLAAGPPVWWCEPNGVTIRYRHGLPLGQLLAAVRYDDPEAGNGFLQPTAVGLETELSPEKSGTLYLRINDSPAELADNAGMLDVKVLSSQ